MPPHVLQDFDLGPCNTLRLPSRAALYMQLQSTADLHALLDDAHLADLPKQVLGGAAICGCPARCRA